MAYVDFNCSVPYFLHTVNMLIAIMPCSWVLRLCCLLVVEFFGMKGMILCSNIEPIMEQTIKVYVYLYQSQGVCCFCKLWKAFIAYAPKDVIWLCCLCCFYQPPMSYNSLLGSRKVGKEESLCKAREPLSGKYLVEMLSQHCKLVRFQPKHTWIYKILASVPALLCKCPSYAYVRLLYLLRLSCSLYSLL